MKDVAATVNDDRTGEAGGSPLSLAPDGVRASEGLASEGLEAQGPAGPENGPQTPDLDTEPGYGYGV